MAKFLFWVLIGVLLLVSYVHMCAHFTPMQIRTGYPILWELIATPWGGFASILLVIRFIGGAAVGRFRRAIRAGVGKK